jgi:predicted dehydrogenase
MEIYTDPSYSIKITKKDGEIVFYHLDAIQTNDNQTSSGIIDAFVESITEDKVPLIDGKDVLHAMKAVFASLQSAKEGRTIEVK